MNTDINQTTIQILANNYNLSLDSSSNTLSIMVLGNMNACIHSAQYSVNLNVSSNGFVSNVSVLTSNQTIISNTSNVTSNTSNTTSNNSNTIIGNTNTIINTVATGYAAWNPPFPRKHLNAIGGVQAFTNNQVLMLFSKFDSVVLGGNWEGWGASGRNMYKTVANIKSVSTNTAPNGTLVFMYLDCTGSYVPSPTAIGSLIITNVNDGFPTYTKEIANNNWWLYTTGASGSINMGSSVIGHINWAAPNLTSSYAGTNWKGETPYQFGAAYAYNLRLGTTNDGRFSSLLPNNKANNADGMFLDNMWRGPFLTADFLRSGNSQITTSADGIVADALSNGAAQFFIRLQETANTSNRSVMNFGNFGDYGKAKAVTNNFNQIMHGGLLEEYFGLSNSPDTWAGYTAMQAMYARAVAICQPPKLVVLHGYFPKDSSAVPQQTEWQWARYIIGSSCMQNGSGAVNRYSQGYSADTIDEIGWYDEWDHNIGYPIDGPAGAPQSAANTNGLWMRQFQNTKTGKKYLWIVNPAKNGTQNVTTANIGGSGIWQFISGNQDPANNNGAIINTTFTLLERDARLLISV